MKLTPFQISQMTHCIGYQSSRVENGVYKAHRNFFGVSKLNETFEELVKKEYAERHYKEMFEEYVYQITPKGIEVLEKELEIKIIIGY